MFYGMFRSEVTKSGAKASVTLEPFHCLQVSDLLVSATSTDVRVFRGGKCVGWGGRGGLVYHACGRFTIGRREGVPVVRRRLNGVRILLPITVCLPLWFQLDLDPPSSSTHPGSNHKSSESSAWGVAASSANGLETTANGVSGKGGGAWGIAGGRGQKIGGVQGANGAWGNGGAGLGTPASGAKTTILEEALAALFRGEAVTGVKGRQNMEVGGVMESHARRGSPE